MVIKINFLLRVSTSTIASAATTAACVPKMCDEERPTIVGICEMDGKGSRVFKVNDKV